MRVPLIVIVGIIAIIVPTLAAMACPEGYVACGERNQLCCPTKK
jgi:hypothetical protein